MNEKKNIDRLFREKFRDFEAVPREDLWQNIEAELLQKKKRRALPLWFRLSGVAVLLVAGLFFLLPVFNQDTFNNGKNPVVIDNTAVPGEGSNSIKKDTALPVSPDNAVTQSATETSGSKTGNDMAAPSRIGNPGNPGEHSGTDSNPGSTDIRKNSANIQTHTKTARHGRTLPFSEQNDIAHIAKSRSGKGKAAHKNIPSPGTGPDTVNPIAIAHATDAESRLAATQRKDPENPASENVAKDGKNSTGNPITTGHKNISSDESAIAEAATDTAFVKQEENPLEKLLREKEAGKKEEAAVAETEKGKWTITPQLAPVFYNSMSKGSPIDQQFAMNNKNFDREVSYGVGVNYALSDRLSIRSGINTVNLGYATDDVVFFAPPGGQAFAASNIASPAKMSMVVENASSSLAGSSKETDLQPADGLNGSMIQKMGYIEVPVEMSYKILDSRFGINFIGGVSTLFLNQNNISVVSGQDGYTADIGKANNLNNIHFSTNVGVGFKYRLWKSLQASFEPIFKYQVNTFSKDAGNFKPYFIGLYSGVSFSF